MALGYGLVNPAGSANPAKCVRKNSPFGSSGSVVVEASPPSASSGPLRWDPPERSSRPSRVKLRTTAATASVASPRRVRLRRRSSGTTDLWLTGVGEPGDRTVGVETRFGHPAGCVVVVVVVGADSAYRYSRSVRPELITVAACARPTYRMCQGSKS